MDRIAELIGDIERRGWRGRVVPIERLAALRDAITGLHGDGFLDEGLYRNQLGFLSFDAPEDLPDARSIIVVAVPTPQMRVFFGHRGRREAIVIPPTYVGYRRRTESVQAALADWLGHEGYRLAKTRLPLKTLAVRSGLAEYGRNNICYVPGLGSFLQLVASYSDIPCDRDPWGEARSLERCSSCVACLRRCPTGAITEERFLLHAERCLTLHNEAEVDFPRWIDPAWHHCLIGCMRCQTACPENLALLSWLEDRGEFSEEETDLLIQRVPLERLPAETAAKLKSLELNEDHIALCRNLSMIVG